MCFALTLLKLSFVVLSFIYLKFLFSKAKFSFVSFFVFFFGSLFDILYYVSFKFGKRVPSVTTFSLGLQL